METSLRDKIFLSIVMDWSCSLPEGHSHTDVPAFLQAFALETPEFPPFCRLSQRGSGRIQIKFLPWSWLAERNSNHYKICPDHSPLGNKNLHLAPPEGTSGKLLQLQGRAIQTINWRGNLAEGRALRLQTEPVDTKRWEQRSRSRYSSDCPVPCTPKTEI